MGLLNKSLQTLKCIIPYKAYGKYLKLMRTLKSDPFWLYFILILLDTCAVLLMPKAVQKKNLNIHTTTGKCLKVYSSPNIFQIHV